MKVKIKKEKTESKREYPYLGVFEDGEIVLFTDVETGMTVGGKDRVGHWSSQWVEGRAKIFQGTITLSND